jgi:hypothetical protein
LIAEFPAVESSSLLGNGDSISAKSNREKDEKREQQQSPHYFAWWCREVLSSSVGLVLLFWFFVGELFFVLPREVVVQLWDSLLFSFLFLLVLFLLLLWLVCDCEEKRGKLETRETNKALLLSALGEKFVLHEQRVSVPVRAVMHFKLQWKGNLDPKVPGQIFSCRPRPWGFFFSLSLFAPNTKAEKKVEGKKGKKKKKMKFVKYYLHKISTSFREDKQEFLLRVSALVLIYILGENKKKKKKESNNNTFLSLQCFSLSPSPSSASHFAHPLCSFLPFSPFFFCVP